MSNQFNPTLNDTLGSKRSWIVCQLGAEGYTHAWANSNGSDQFLTAKGADVSDLKQRIVSESGEVQEIPAHFKSLPTGMDLQVHLRFPGQEEKENLEGGLAAAFAGGYDALLTMPNSTPFLDDPKVLQAAISELNQRFPASVARPRVFFSVSATQQMAGETPSDLAGLMDAGGAAVTDDGWGVRSDDAMLEIFRKCAELNVPFLQHAEMPGHKGFAPASAFQKKNEIPEYPRTAESDMVARDVALLRKVPGARYHVLHISTRETLAEIRKAKDEGLAITCEVTPHHLFFANTDIPAAENEISTFFKMNPPLFDPEDRAALVEALESGLIDCVSTDHAPHSLEAKRGGWIAAPFGTRGLVTALPTLLTLFARGDLSWNRLVEVYAQAPRTILGQQEIMRPRGLLFVDPDVEFSVAKEDLCGISKNSCYIGAKLQGRIELRGEPGQLFTRNS